MKTLKLTLLFFLLILLLLYCGKKDKSIDNNKTSTTKKSESVLKINKTKFSNYSVDDTGQRIPEIKAVSFTGVPFENRNLEADVHLSIPDDKLEFRFVWVVNNETIENEESNILPESYFKSGDWVFCRVKIINSKIETKEVKSKYIKILGTTPVLKMEPIPKISIPGEFRYKIKAFLPGSVKTDAEDDYVEDQENSNLEFTLLSPTDKGIFLDKYTGEITWFISNSIASAIGDKIKIEFQVSNPEGGSVNSSILLSFKSAKSDIEPE